MASWLKRLPGLAHDAGELGGALVGGQAEELHQLVDGPAQAPGVEDLEQEAVAGVVGDVEGFDGVVDAAGVVGERQGAVHRRDHLRQAAGLERRGHDDDVGGGVAEAGEALVEVAHGDPVVEAVHARRCGGSGAGTRRWR